MPSKSGLQATLKEKYGINKNITQSLSSDDCENLLNVLSAQPSAERVIRSFIEKNIELSANNRYFGQLRSQAEKKNERLQVENQAFKAEIDQLATENQGLGSDLQTLTAHNEELIKANDQLKKDNKELKNVVDQIRLRLAQDTKMLLQYEDSEIRKALIRMFRWTLG
ncbi:hypothetical protein IQ241_06500 [Romeria aff. gracilis LEGE 07310]|uniref:Uncharacterized protein n=1 Tax=Vasconcelosia minhoensis LEGE 07310 TaxID=915328 RepID=A0A8J7AG79_9CYAN|nr:hypothetical protein [Romeria gracilis]MBE9076948.1 hypothetical protein [Romeria aff. gracilis LEGE 07310]